MNKYNIILIDPPWQYKDKAKVGNRGAECKYNVMSIEDIKNMPVGKIADDNCILFLWVTFPMLQEGLDSIKSWGFTYKTVAFTWAKKNRKGKGLFMGMGHWTRSNAEVCLLAVKGKPKRLSASVRSIVVTPIEQHSKKPDIVREKIVELMGDLPRIEIFAREKAEGWDAIGEEITDNDVMVDLKRIIKKQERGII